MLVSCRIRSGMGVCTSAAESKTATSSTTPVRVPFVQSCLFSDLIVCSHSSQPWAFRLLQRKRGQPRLGSCRTDQRHILSSHSKTSQRHAPSHLFLVAVSFSAALGNSACFLHAERWPCCRPIGDALAEALSPFSSDLVSLVASYVTHGNPALDITLQYSFKPITSADRCFAVLWHRGRFWAAFKDNVRLLSDDGKLLRILPQLAVRMMVAAPSSEVLLLVHDTYEWPRVAICNANGDHVCMAYFPVPTGLNKSWYDPSSACVLDSVGNLLLTIKDGKLRRFVILKQALDPETILALNRKSLFLNWEWWQPDVDAGENCCYGRLAVHNDEIFIGARDCVKVSWCSCCSLCWFLRLLFLVCRCLIRTDVLFVSSAFN